MTGRSTDEKKPARRPVLLALLAELLGGSSRSSFGSGSSRSSFGSGSGGSGGSSFGSGSGRSGSSNFRSGGRSFFFLATGGQRNGEQGGEQDGIFHLGFPNKKTKVINDVFNQPERLRPRPIARILAKKSQTARGQRK
jgi:hypothetical protein